MKKCLIVGAGLSGVTIARLLAEDGFSVHVIDERDHVAGNAYDYVNDKGIRVHRYGPHIFHTNNTKVFEWLGQFTEWIEYKHKVKAMLSDGRLVTLPVNAETLATVGRDNVVATFIAPYTKKMWSMDVEKIDSSVLARVPIREDMNELYFPDDLHQCMPRDGYTALVENMLKHPNISIELSRKFVPGEQANYLHVFNSMPIDEYYDYRFGALPYRSIKFHSVDLPIPKVFPVSVVNFTHDLPYTRVTEWKNFPSHGGSSHYTTLTYEEPCDYVENDYQRFYPVKDSDGLNRKKYDEYKSIPCGNMTFIGRCGLYAYLDMHQAVSSAMSIAKDFIIRSES